ncbi:MAG: DegT/DnrJ/EryC1/StrS family aminotransferase, partial [Gloeomargarita sp. SKYG116]|nr:DegT/DnrJ/EryC1/StrS family aminotransferase [Gloeomargarita sp. SKYG116]MDW8402494.1 DegT/DnrJ/EryC1/StrS family aminotransferase [Gloeomargarita sp. SKYGB_i_bin116]
QATLFRYQLQRYQERLSSLSNLGLPLERPYAYHSYHLYPVRLTQAERRKEAYRKLRQAGIGVQVHYIPVYWHPFMQAMGYKKGLCPAAEDFYSRLLSLPIYPGLREEEHHQVIRILKEVVC